MKDNNKRELLLTTAICLLPIVAGALLYSRLPEQLPTHFDIHGEADGWTPRALMVFGMPVLMALFNLIIHFMLRSDPKRANANPTLFAVGIWTVPVLSALSYAMTLSHALGRGLPVEVIVPVLVGVLLIVIGNYLPKTRQSYTVGFKLPWTLNSEENWNRTHRLAGFLFVLGGAAMVVLALLHLLSGWVLLPLLAVMVLVPTVYSYLLYRKGI